MTARLDTTNELRRVAVHIVARARQQATGRFSLRVAAGGFGTPEFGDDARRVRVAGSDLVVESDRPGAAAIRSMPLVGSSLAELAAFAGVDLDAPLDVGHDTPALGDVDAPIRLDPAHLAEIHRCHAVSAAALDLVVGSLGEASPTLPRLWPEHFDVALDAEARPGVRVNLGGSPGDGFCAEPYVFVGPWTDDRPGDDGFWNAPFGAFRPLSDLGDDPNSVAAFLRTGLDRLSG